MSEHACGGGVLCFTGKKKKRGTEVSGSFTSMGTEASLRESHKHSHEG